MLGWLVGRRRRDEQLAADMMRAATLRDRLHRLSQALATISTETRIVSTVVDQSQLGRLNMILDVFRSLTMLAAHPRVDRLASLSWDGRVPRRLPFIQA
jgi:hypothetical protein